MKLLRVDFRQHPEYGTLGLALLLLIAALFRPAIPLKQDVHTYLFIVDITQSMNAEDMMLDGKKVSRMAYTRRTLQDTIASLPCGTRVSLALFAGVVVSTLYYPIEVCESFDAIYDTIENLDWRQAWHGNSRIGFGLLSGSVALHGLREPAQVVFITDGEEAPRLHAFNTADLSNWQGGAGWLLVGIGGDQPVPVPKMDEHNKKIGYWSKGTSQLTPGIAQVSEETRGQRDDTVATADYDKYLSSLDEKYLSSVAEEIHGTYVRGDHPEKVVQAIQHQKPVKRMWVKYPIHQWLAALAGLLILVSYVPVQTVKARVEALRSLIKPRRWFAQWAGRRQ